MPRLENPLNDVGEDAVNSPYLDYIPPPLLDPVDEEPFDDTLYIRRNNPTNNSVELDDSLVFYNLISSLDEDQFVNNPEPNLLNNPEVDASDAFLFYLQQLNNEYYDDIALHCNLSNVALETLHEEYEDPNEDIFPDKMDSSSILNAPPNTPAEAFPTMEYEQDDFLDADAFEDEVQDISTMDLLGSLADCEKAIELFFNNQLNSAIAIMVPWKSTSLYHAHGAAIFEFIPAMLTLEPAQIQRAQDALRQTFTLCTQLRRSYTFVQSIGAIIKKPNYGGYTEEEAHAELVHAEALLLLACLGIIENEDMTGLFRASLRVKTSYSGYRACEKILKNKSWENEESRAHFESGVRLGLATFNVMLAMLPPRIVALLEFVGFSADKEKGKEELMKGAQSPGLRSILCELTLLVYYLVIGHFAAIPPDFNAAENIIAKSLNKFPNSVWFLIFKARTQLLRGQILDAIETYQKTCRMENLWPQMKHLAYWELVWAFAMLKRWTNATEYAGLLERYSKWSRTIYMYAQAAMLIENGSHTAEERKRIEDLLTNASTYRQRVLGRSVPMEKFVLKRCERWSKRGYLILPGIEWLYLWNIFPSLAANRNHVDEILKIIEKARMKIKTVMDKATPKAIEHGTAEYDIDDQALVEFLNGALLAAMSLPYQALGHLETVIAMKDYIKDHTFLLPYSLVEMAFCYYQLGQSLRATELLQESRKKYSGYLLESRLQFRIHSKLELIKGGIKYNEMEQNPAKKIYIPEIDIMAARKAQPSINTNSEPKKTPSTCLKSKTNSNTSTKPVSSKDKLELNSRSHTGSTINSTVNSNIIGTAGQSFSNTDALRGPTSSNNKKSKADSLSESYSLTNKTTTVDVTPRPTLSMNTGINTGVTPEQSVSIQTASNIDVIPGPNSSDVTQAPKLNDYSKLGAIPKIIDTNSKKSSTKKKTNTNNETGLKLLNKAVLEISSSETISTTDPFNVTTQVPLPRANAKQKPEMITLTNALGNIDVDLITAADLELSVTPANANTAVLKDSTSETISTTNPFTVITQMPLSRANTKQKPEMITLTNAPGNIDMDLIPAAGLELSVTPANANTAIIKDSSSETISTINPFTVTTQVPLSEADTKQKSEMITSTNAPGNIDMDLIPADDLELSVTPANANTDIFKDSSSETTSTINPFTVTTQVLLSRADTKQKPEMITLTNAPGNIDMDLITAADLELSVTPANANTAIFKDSSSEKISTINPFTVTTQVPLSRSNIKQKPEMITLTNAPGNIDTDLITAADLELSVTPANANTAVLKDSSNETISTRNPFTFTTQVPLSRANTKQKPEMITLTNAPGNIDMDLITAADLELSVTPANTNTAVFKDSSNEIISTTNPFSVTTQEPLSRANAKQKLNTRNMTDATGNIDMDLITAADPELSVLPANANTVEACQDGTCMPSWCS